MDPMRRKTEPVYVRSAVMFSEMLDFLAPTLELPEQPKHQQESYRCSDCGRTLFEGEREDGICVDCLK